MLTTFFCLPGKSKNIDTGSKIVIIGLGVASFTFASELKRAGFRNVTIVAKDINFGGKCVNYGCMPAEYALTLNKIPLDLRKGYLHKFRSELSERVGKQFEILGYRIIESEALEINDINISLGKHSPLTFDYAVLAIGSYYPKPERVPLNTNKEVLIEDVWGIDPGKNLIIYAKDNIAAIAIADSVRTLGANVTVLLAGKNPYGKLPSYQFYLRGVKSSGVNVIEGIRLIRVDQDGISIENGSRIETLQYDSLLVASKPVSNFPKIDKKIPTLNEIDLTTGALYSRSDVYFAGDGAGYMTAAEAEYQAHMLGKYFSEGRRVDLDSLSKIPLVLNGHCPLAMIGELWTISENPASWREIDFSVLGYTKVSGRHGKLWYLLNQKTNRLDAIHICHPSANELISYAASLLEKPLSDPIWLYGAIHPSAMEIFKIIAIRELKNG